MCATHRLVSDVLRDMKGMGAPSDRVLDWLAGSGSQVQCNLRDSTAISFNIEDAAHRNKGRRVKIATDVLSAPGTEPSGAPVRLLVPAPSLRQAEGLGGLRLGRGRDAPPRNVLTTMERLFDGVIEMKLHEEGLAITPLLWMRKMFGLPPLHGCFRFSITGTGMEVLPYVR